MEKKCIQNFGPEAWREGTIRKSRVWEDHIKMELRKIGWEVVDWIHLAQDRDHW